MAIAIAHQSGRRPASVSGRLIAFFTVSIAASYKIRTDVSRLKASPVDRSDRHLSLHNAALLGRLHGLVEQPLHMSGDEKSSRRFLKRAEVRRLLETNGCRQVRRVFQQRRKLAVI